MACLVNETLLLCIHIQQDCTKRFPKRVKEPLNISTAQVAVMASQNEERLNEIDYAWN